MRTLLMMMAAGLLVAAQPAPEPAPEPAPAGEDEGSRVVRGTPALPGSAPWQIQIYLKASLTPGEIARDRGLRDNAPEKRFYHLMREWEQNHLCGGALIDKEWALSAAHCFVGPKEGLYSLPLVGARVGNIDLDHATPMRIERIIIHGDYRRYGSKQHDIALLKLVPDTETRPDIATAAAPARVITPDMRPLEPGDSLKVTGWGHFSERESGASRAVDGSIMRSSRVLLEGQLTLADPAECARVPRYRKTLNPGVLCVAAGDNREQDSCQGDSGGPLTRNRVLVGLVSTGEGCGQKGVPALYTNVAFYAEWIRAVQETAPAGVIARCLPVVRAGHTTVSCDTANRPRTNRG